MKTRLAALAVLVLLPAAALAAPGDKPGCADHPLFPTRLPDYKITDCKVTEYDSVRFLKMKQPELTVEGKGTYLFYQRPPGQGAAALEIVRNYQNALTKIGATIVDIDERRFVYGKVVQDGREVWAQAEARPGGMIRLYVVEKKAMTQHVVADAAAFSNDLKSTGHVAVYGIYFDTAKSELKPESTPALQEVAKLLGSDPGLRLWVVGHTDGVGAIDANLKLSQARAEAVVAALTTTYKIAPARLRGHGVGPLAPVASNAAEEGRAKNRRVELVQQ
jgi:outer membrane protein OmpA-like peptidoglycan-associated protein